MPRVSEATKAEYRARLLSAAASEFANKGLDGARVDDISLAAGLAKGTIYNYFDSKRDVFRAVVAEWAQRVADSRTPLPDDAPMRDQLLAIVNADVQVTAEMGAFARTAFREVLTAAPDVVAELLPAWDPLDAEIERVMTIGQQRGDVRDDRSPAELTRVFLTLVNGLLFEHWMSGTIALDDIPTLAVDYYLEGAGRQP